MADVVQGVVNHDMDTNTLFEKYKIEEIRDIEKKTRSDIERKKEDLRVMVGERYRDLIEAADTITEMKNSSENVMQSINRMQELCQKMKQDHMVKGFNIVSKPKLDVNKRREETQFYGIAAQIKLLLDMPEKVWSALDGRAYLRATRLYLLARHVHTSMQVGSSASTTRLLTKFPVLARTWAAISHFRDVILQACRDMLKRTNISAEKTAECLCSLLLLEDSTPRQVFNDFLILSSTAMQQLFQPDQSGMSVKDQVCAVVQMVVRTVHQIYAVFYAGSDVKDCNVESNLLMTILGKVTDKGDSGVILTDLDDSPSMKYLPATVQDFRPTLRNHATPIAEKNLQENSQQWIAACVQSVSAGLRQLLQYVTTVRSLASIRSSVCEQLAADPRLACWAAVCQATLRRPLAVWEEFCQPHFLERTTTLLQTQYDSTLSSCKQQISHVLNELSSTDNSVLCERDVASYVWTEGATDIPNNLAWLTVGTKLAADAGTLTMKARAYTPAVQNLCRSFDGRLKALLEDAAHYLRPPAGSSSSSHHPSALSSSFSLPSGSGPAQNASSATETTEVFDQYADTPTILSFLQDSCDSCVTRLLEFLQTQLYACRQQLSPEGNQTSNLLILDRILVLGRLSSAFCELSIYLQQCMSGPSDKADATGNKRTVSGKGHGKIHENPRWTKVKDKLQTFSQESFSFWAEYTASTTAFKYKAALLDNSGSSLLRSSTRWDAIEIQEETEEGKTMSSTIRVPMQPSSYVAVLLYQLCQQLNRVGGHAFTKPVLRKLVHHLSDSIMATYLEVAQSKKTAPSALSPSSRAGQQDEATKEGLPLNQTRALQLLFDVRLIAILLPRNEDLPENKQYQQQLQKVIDTLESHIDPFDLDVFSPYMNTYIMRQTQRFSVLFGSLISLDRHGMYLNTRPSQASHQEHHNVLPLSTSQTRLPLLPLSVQSRPLSIAPPILQPPKPKMSMEPSSPPPELPLPRNESSGFLANMSTLWFSNVSKK